MKKLILLLLVMAMGAGMVFAASDPIHPPGVLIPEVVMAEYGVQQGVVTQSSDLASFTVPFDVAHPPGVPAMAPDSYVVYYKPPGNGQDWTDTAADFYLRC